ncbi:MAG: hypothetical protein WBF24_18660 [Xanthobacteraceae bacterium]
MTQYWQHTDLTAAAVGVQTDYVTPYAYVTGQPAEGQIPRVLYVPDWGNGGDIHEVRFQNGNWIDADLSTLLTNFSGDFQAEVLAMGYQTPDGVARVVFLGLDGWVQEFKLETDGWTVANLSAIAGMTNKMGFSRAQPYSIPAWGYYSTPDGHARVVYSATDGHVHELSLHYTDPHSGWIDSDLNALAIAGGWDAPNRYNDPFGYLAGDSIPRVVYNDADSFGVRELRLEPGGWICANIGALANAPPGMPVNMEGEIIGAVDTTAYVMPDAIARVVYLGNDGHAHELKLVNNQSAWLDTDLTQKSGSPTTPAGMLYGCCGSDGIARAFYPGNDGHLHHFSYQNGGWSNEDLFANGIVVNPPPGGIAATSSTGMIPYAYAFGGAVQIVYPGGDQHIHLLSQILGTGHERHKTWQQRKRRGTMLSRTRL